jgi:hypothetical protein
LHPLESAALSRRTGIADAKEEVHHRSVEALHDASLIGGGLRNSSGSLAMLAAIQWGQP